MGTSVLHRFSLKRGNVQTFLFFLLFTSILWLIIQFSKNYTKEVEVNINYINLPEDRILNPQSDQKLKLTLNGNGFRLLTQSWSSTELKMDIEQVDRVQEDAYYFSLAKEQQFWKDKLDFNGKILGFTKDSIRAVLDINLRKKVPISPFKTITFANGFSSDKGLKTIPDSAWVSGPSRMVDSIYSVKTELIELEDLNADYKGDFKLSIENLGSQIQIEPETVEVTIDVKKFTEGRKKVPINLINVPKDTEVKIFPKDITVIYRVALDLFKDISERDFRVVADYEKASDNSSFLILELIDQPEFIHDVRLESKQVQYVILNGSSS